VWETVVESSVSQPGLSRSHSHSHGRQLAAALHHQQHYHRPIAVGMVMRTGFSTARGQLVRAILFPPPPKFDFEAQVCKQRAGQNRTGHGAAENGWLGAMGRAGQGRAGHGRAGQGRPIKTFPSSHQPHRTPHHTTPQQGYRFIWVLCSALIVGATIQCFIYAQ
jgi:hypothetical protein